MRRFASGASSCQSQAIKDGHATPPYQDWFCSDTFTVHKDILQEGYTQLTSIRQLLIGQPVISEVRKCWPVELANLELSGPLCC